MIRFHLKCDKDHEFESWFQSGNAFDRLVAAGMVSCATCGSTAVTKTIMAPAVSTSKTIAPPKPAENPLHKLRDEVEANSDYVGNSFVQEARDMHDGVIPERPIYGEAKIDDAKKLVEDGVPVLPLPFVPRKKTN
ncbi:DUF1178 family protein [Yoonia sp. BS5-3]|uniref:DUF1178 family protein n=1 Tax=Yoonia phaeophyticola TaxID=3137369 RepID=A0ABZ2V357_9RHOB